MRPTDSLGHGLSSECKRGWESGFSFVMGSKFCFALRCIGKEISKLGSAECEQHDDDDDVSGPGPGDLGLGWKPTSWALQASPEAAPPLVLVGSGNRHLRSGYNKVGEQL